MADPRYSSYDIVAIQNIDDEDFIFEYDKSSGNYPHVIPAGEVRRFPRFLAEHALKHLIDKVITKNYPKRRTNDETLRQDLAVKIVIEEEVLQKPPQKTEAEVLKEEVDRLNKPSELDAILQKHREQAKPAEEVSPEKPKEEFAELKPDKEDVGPEVDTTDKDTPPAEEVKAIPSRAEIYKYAETKLNLVLDAEDKEGKTLRQKFDKMKIPELLKIADPREDLT